VTAPAGGAGPGELDRWLARQAARERRIVPLEQALLGDRLGAYAWYRLRFFLLGYVVEAAGHAVLVLALLTDVSVGDVLLVAAAQAAATLAGRFWWGALEALRTRVRDLHRAGQAHRIPSVVGGWMWISLVLAGSLAVGLVAVLVACAVTGSLGAAQSYLLALVARVALELPTRTWHSGVYAMRRVHQPLAATVAPELMGLATLLALHAAAGVWAVVAAAVVTTVAATVASVHYTGRVYRFLGFRIRPEITPAAARAAVRDWRDAGAGGVAQAVMAVDALVVLALLQGGERDPRAALLLYVAMPAVRAAADWAGLMYFDLKRLELRVFANLRRRFDRHTARLAWLIGLGAWVIAVLGDVAGSGPGVGGIHVALLAFFLTRSVLARAQVRAFADGAYPALVGTGAASLAGLGAAGALVDGATPRLVAIGVVAAATAGTLLRVSAGGGRASRPALLTLEWLRLLGQTRTPVRVGSARLRATAPTGRADARSRVAANRWRLDQLAGRLAGRVGPSGAAAWIGPDRVVWFEPAGAVRRVSVDWLQRAGGGLITEVADEEAVDGEHALLAAARGELLGRSGPHLRTAVVPVDAPAVRAHHAALFPGAVVYSPAEPAPPALTTLPGSELRAILADATSFARDLRVGHRSRFEVTSLCAGGELELVFVTDPAADRRIRREWTRRLVALNVRAAIAGTSPGAAGPRKLSLGSTHG
jgi:hypothetical protein